MFPKNAKDDLLSQIAQLTAKLAAEGTNTAFEIREKDLDPVELYFATPPENRNREIFIDPDFDRLVAKIYQDPDIVRERDRLSMSLRSQQQQTRKVAHPTPHTHTPTLPLPENSSASGTKHESSNLIDTDGVIRELYSFTDHLPSHNTYPSGWKIRDFWEVTRMALNSAEAIFAPDGKEIFEIQNKDCTLFNRIEVRSISPQETSNIQAFIEISDFPNGLSTFFLMLPASVRGIMFTASRVGETTQSLVVIPTIYFRQEQLQPFFDFLKETGIPEFHLTTIQNMCVFRKKSNEELVFDDKLTRLTSSNFQSRLELSEQIDKQFSEVKIFAQDGSYVTRNTGDATFYLAEVCRKKGLMLEAFNTTKVLWARKNHCYRIATLLLFGKLVFDARARLLPPSDADGKVRVTFDADPSLGGKELHESLKRKIMGTAPFIVSDAGISRELLNLFVEHLIAFSGSKNIEVSKFQNMSKVIYFYRLIAILAKEIEALKAKAEMRPLTTIENIKTLFKIMKKQGPTGVEQLLLRNLVVAGDGDADVNLNLVSLKEIFGMMILLADIHYKLQNGLLFFSSSTPSETASASTPSETSGSTFSSANSSAMDVDTTSSSSASTPGVVTSASVLVSTSAMTATTSNTNTHSSIPLLLSGSISSATSGSTLTSAMDVASSLRTSAPSITSSASAMEVTAATSTNPNISGGKRRESSNDASAVEGLKRQRKLQN